MSQNWDNEAMLRRYLLGSVSDEERQEIERWMLMDGAFFDQLCALEEELVDEYVFDRLSPEDRDKFQKSFLSNPEGVEQIQFATNLRTAARSTPPAQIPASLNVAGPASRRPGVLPYLRPKVSVSRYAFAAMAAVCFLIIISMAIVLGRLQTQLNQMRLQQPLSTVQEQELQEQLDAEKARNAELAEELRRDEARRAELEQQLARLNRSDKDRPEQFTVASLVLMPGRVRGGPGSRNLVIGPGISRAQLQLILTRNGYALYQATLKTVDGREIWSKTSLEPLRRMGRDMVQVSLPVEILSTGDFSLSLQGAGANGNYEEVGTYYFSVTKK